MDWIGATIAGRAVRLGRTAPTDILIAHYSAAFCVSLVAAMKTSPNSKRDALIYITEVHLSSGGTSNEHIVAVKWRNPQTGATGASTREEMVNWIKSETGDARVRDEGGEEARVGVVEANPPYIRTYADGLWNDNLLALPRY